MPLLSGLWMRFVTVRRSVMDSLLAIEVAYADDCRQVIIPVEVPEGTTLAGALVLSGIGDLLTGVDVGAASKGIWGQKRPDDWRLEEGDRVEIYRPLVHDPREARRRRAVYSDLARSANSEGT